MELASSQLFWRQRPEGQWVPGDAVYLFHTLNALLLNVTFNPPTPDSTNNTNKAAH